MPLFDNTSGHVYQTVCILPEHILCLSVLFPQGTSPVQSFFSFMQLFRLFFGIALHFPYSNIQLSHNNLAERERSILIERINDGIKNMPLGKSGKRYNRKTGNVIGRPVKVLNLSKEEQDMLKRV